MLHIAKYVLQVNIATHNIIVRHSV